MNKTPIQKLLLKSRMDGIGEKEKQQEIVRNGFWVSLFNTIIFVIIGIFLVHGYYETSSNQEAVREAGIEYTQIALFFSFGIFLEASFTKMLQAKGNW